MFYQVQGQSRHYLLYLHYDTFNWKKSLKCELFFDGTLLCRWAAQLLLYYYKINYTHVQYDDRTCHAHPSGVPGVTPGFLWELYVFVCLFFLNFIFIFLGLLLCIVYVDCLFSRSGHVLIFWIIPLPMLLFCRYLWTRCICNVNSETVWTMGGNSGYVQNRVD